MSDIVLKVQNICKQYRLGLVGTNTLRDDLSRFWAKIRGKEDPTLQIGQTNDRQNITSKYVWALQDIDFEVKRGEVVGIVGKNGAGKSTLLKILSKVTSPTKGEIKTKGRIASLLEVGTGFHPELTGRENIFLNGAILGMYKHEIKSKFDEIVEFSGIGNYIDTPVKRYSSGMYVRLAFAVAAHLDPEILIIDEVLAVGDAEFQKKCLGKMKDVAGEGRTVLFVSHNMVAVKNICQRGIYLKEGKLFLDGNVGKVVNSYLSIDLKNAENAFKYFPENPAKDFQVLEACIKNNEKEVASNLHCDEDITIELKCISRNKIPNLYGYMTLSYVDGEVILESDSFDGGQNNFDNLEIGFHTFQIKIPKRTIAKGQYVVYMNFSSPNANKFDVDSPMYMLRFDVIDSASKRGNQRNGYFSTLLAWEKMELK